MSQENVEILRRSNEAFNRGDRAGALRSTRPELLPSPGRRNASKSEGFGLLEAEGGGIRTPETGFPA